MQEVLDSLAKIGKQWGLGESVGRVWGFLLLKSYPVTQKEIEEGTGYSRGLISRCLRVLSRVQMIEVDSDGKEKHYSAITSLTESFDDVLKRLLTDRIDPMIELLSGSLDKIGDPQVRETFLALLNEYKKLNLTILIFSRIIGDININAITVDEWDMEGYVQKKFGYRGGVENGTE